MAIIKQYHKETDTTYVYESVSYWDDEKKQSRSKRRLLGKIDPATGEVIPTGKRGRKKKNPENIQETSTVSTTNEQSREKIRELTIALSESNERISALEKENRMLRDAILHLEKHASSCMALCAPFTNEGR